MKNLSFLLLLFVLYCKNGKNPDKVSPANDTLQQKQSQAPVRVVDTLEEKRAFDKVYFGMKRAEAEKLISFATYSKLGNEEYVFLPNYNQGDSLYFIEINGRKKTALYYETDLLREWSNLDSIITAAYGKADIDKAYPHFTEMHNGFVNFAKEWYLGDKVVKIGVAEDEAEFYTACWIYSDAMKKDTDRRNR